MFGVLGIREERQRVGGTCRRWRRRRRNGGQMRSRVVRVRREGERKRDKRSQRHKIQEERG